MVARRRCMHCDIKPGSIAIPFEPSKAVILEVGVYVQERSSNEHRVRTIEWLSPEAITLKQHKKDDTTYDFSTMLACSPASETEAQTHGPRHSYVQRSMYERKHMQRDFPRRPEWDKTSRYVSRESLAVVVATHKAAKTFALRQIQRLSMGPRGMPYCQANARRTREGKE